MCKKLSSNEIFIYLCGFIFTLIHFFHDLFIAQTGEYYKLLINKNIR